MGADFLLTLATVALAIYGFYCLASTAVDAIHRRLIRRPGYLLDVTPNRPRLGLDRGERR